MGNCSSKFRERISRNKGYRYDRVTAPVKFTPFSSDAFASETYNLGLGNSCVYPK